MELDPLTYTEDLQRAKFRKSVTGHNFWLEWPSDLISTPLSYIFNALFRDTPLAYLMSRHVMSHKWHASRMSRVKSHSKERFLCKTPFLTIDRGAKCRIKKCCIFWNSYIDDLRTGLIYIQYLWSHNQAPSSHWTSRWGKPEKKNLFRNFYIIQPFAISSLVTFLKLKLLLLNQCFLARGRGSRIKQMHNSLCLKQQRKSSAEVTIACLSSDWTMCKGRGISTTINKLQMKCFILVTTGLVRW